MFAAKFSRKLNRWAGAGLQLITQMFASDVLAFR